MKRLTFILILSILVTTAHRLPAPISEEASPTPAQSVKPKAKHSTKTTGENNQDSGKSRAAKSEQSSTPRPSGKARNLNGPSPQIPAEAAKQHLTGTGTYLLRFDQANGTVTDVTVVQSTGSSILDEAAMAAFRQWHEDPNCAKEVTMTMRFTAAGAQ